MTKYEFTDPPRPNPPDPVELLPTPHKLLIEAGRALKVLSLQTGALNPILQEAAQRQAAYQAEFAQMGHQRWDSRSKVLFAAMPEYTGFREVCAYSGYEQPVAAKNIFQTWRNSPDHWVWVNGRCDILGYAMYQNANNKLWYACGIFADRRAWMGWASGSSLAEDLWLAVRRYIPEDKHKRRDVAREIVDLFESIDCDTMEAVCS